MNKLTDKLWNQYQDQIVQATSIYAQIAEEHVNINTTSNEDNLVLTFQWIDRDEKCITEETIETVEELLALLADFKQSAITVFDESLCSVFAFVEELDAE